MIDWLTPTVLALSIGSGDYLSTRAAISRGGVETNQLGPKIGPAVTALAVAGSDLYIQKHAPKVKWYWRGALVVAGAALIVHNHQAAR